MNKRGWIDRLVAMVLLAMFISAPAFATAFNVPPTAPGCQKTDYLPDEIVIKLPPTIIVRYGLMPLAATISNSFLSSRRWNTIKDIINRASEPETELLRFIQHLRGQIEHRRTNPAPAHPRPQPPSPALAPYS